MRTCQSCGKENPPDQDFCSCGEYLRWEPTGFVQAITPEMAAEAAAQAAPPKPPEPAPTTPPDARVTPAAPPAPAPGNGNGHARRGAARAARAPGSAPADRHVAAGHRPADALVVARAAAAGREDAGPRRRARPPAQPQSPPAEPNEPATIVLRLPEGDPAKGETLHQAVEPGQRERVLALIRNQSGIVDNYDLRVEGMPRGLVVDLPRHGLPRPVRLRRHVRAGGRDPPAPAARPGGRGAGVGPDDRRGLQGDAHGRGVGAAGAAHPALHRDRDDAAPAAQEGPPQGRPSTSRSTNKANAPVLVALEGEDPDGELQFGFNRPPQEIPPGAAIDVADAGQPAQADLDRPRARSAARGQDRHRRGGGRARRRPSRSAPTCCCRPGRRPRRSGTSAGAPQVPGIYRPRVYKPQLYPPDVKHGPGRPAGADADSSSSRSSRARR